MTALVFEAAAGVALDALEDELARAFHALRDALAAGRAVVVVLDDEAVRGAGDPVAAAHAHALLGMVRALATEGRRPGWRVNALAAPRELPAAERAAWVARLAEPAGASGALVRLGAEHLGRVPA